MWIKSTTGKRYTINGNVIPAQGDKGYLQVAHAEWQTALNNPVIKSLVEAGDIFATDKTPAGAVTVDRSAGKVAELNAKNSQLESELKALKEQLEQAKKDNATIMEEAKKEIAALKSTKESKGSK